MKSKVYLSSEQKSIFREIFDSSEPANAFDIAEKIGYPRPFVYRLLRKMLKNDIIREVKTEAGIKAYVPTSDITGVLLEFY